MDSSRDPSDEFNNLVDNLKEFTESSAVYIGKVCCPMNEVGDEDDDTAHIKPEAVPQI